MNDNENMNQSQVTNWMIYELLKDFKEDTGRRFDEVDKKFDEVNGKFYDIKGEMSEDRKKLNEIYESRNYVTVKFTRAWTFASLFVAVFASMTVLAFDKAF